MTDCVGDGITNITEFPVRVSDSLILFVETPVIFLQLKIVIINTGT